MVRVDPLLNTYPDFREADRTRTNMSREKLQAHGVKFKEKGVSLLETEDRVLDIFDEFLDEAEGKKVIIDISSFPKRMFCFAVKYFLSSQFVDHMVAVYTSAKSGGYGKRLAYEPRPPDYLPGFPFPVTSDNELLVLSVGYEQLGMRRLIEAYSEISQPKFILSISGDVDAVRRQWATLRLVHSVHSLKSGQDIEVIAAWDAERVFDRLSIWNRDVGGMVLAPFGPKPHTLGMALFAHARNFPMVYTQPTVYDPEYSSGEGETTCYLVKWDGIACFDRNVKPI
jgi:hypothetical protein